MNCLVFPESVCKVNAKNLIFQIFSEKNQENLRFFFYFTKEQGQNRVIVSTLSLLYMRLVSQDQCPKHWLCIPHKHLKGVIEICRPIQSSVPEPYRLPRQPQTSPYAGIQISRRRSHWGMFSHFDYNPVLPH